MEKKVLFVDDEEMILEVYKSVFEDTDYHVFTAGNGEEGFELYKRENIQVIYTDLKMPVMNGIDFCRRIRETNPICLISAITGFPTLFELAESRETGFDDYFTKPIDTKELMKSVRDSFQKMERWKK